MTRYEFAAGLNACLDTVNELIASATADLASQEDLLVLQRLQEEFQAELATLRGRVDSLEARTAELEANQFSTTTKLSGQAILGFSSVLSGDDVNGNDAPGNAVFSDRLRLGLETSFTGEDLLYARLATGNTANLLSDTTTEGSLSFEQVAANHNVSLEVLLYKFPIGDRTELVIGPVGVATDDFTDTVNFLDGDGAEGAISAFGTRSSIYYPPAGAGIGLRHQFNDLLAVSAGYLAAEADDPGSGSGFFNGDYGAIAQLYVTPSEAVSLGLTYVHGYNVEMGTGSNRANPKTFLEGEFLGTNAPISSDALGLAASWQLNDRFVLGGWGAYSNVDVLGGPKNSLDIWTGAITLAVLDLFKEGNVAGFVVGVEPKVTRADTAILEDQDTSIHVEGFFQYKLSDYITITPGLIWLTAPDHNAGNSDALIGTVRTTFSF